MEKTLSNGNDRRMRRVEGWFTPYQTTWLRTLKVTENLPVSRILRRALDFYLDHHIRGLRVKMATCPQPYPTVNKSEAAE